MPAGGSLYEDAYRTMPITYTCRIMKDITKTQLRKASQERRQLEKPVRKAGKRSQRERQVRETSKRSQ